LLALADGPAKQWPAAVSCGAPPGLVMLMLARA
jgi:hypothetical protein